MTDVWDDFKGEDGVWVKFENDGDGAEGTIVDIFSQENFNKDGKNPVLVLETDAGALLNVSCGPVNLRKQVLGARPQVGQTASVFRTGLGQAQRGKQAPKLFDFKVSGEPDESKRLNKAVSADPEDAVF